MPNLGGEKSTLPPRSTGAPLTAPVGLRHEGKHAPSPRALLRLAAAFLTEAVAAGLPTLSLTSASRLTALRRALRARAGGVDWVDTDVLGRNPARLLPVIGEFVRAHGGTQARVFGDLSWPRLAGPVRDELCLHEVLLATPECASWPLSLLCCYDGATVGAETAAMFDDLHNARVSAAEALAAFATDLPDPPPSASRFPADITTLAELRRFVHDHAAAAGVAPDRVNDLVYAVNEVVTNSICHGAGHADLSAWTEPTFFCCDVRDGGRIADPLVGRVAPHPGADSGRGLWLVHHLCDLVQVRSPSSGTTVRMRMERTPSR